VASLVILPVIQAAITPPVWTALNRNAQPRELRGWRYGDRFPMSSAGRGVAVVLMIAGIAMFGVITATIAAYFVEQKAEQDLTGRLDQIMERLDRI
jgi:hypothetical protein